MGILYTNPDGYRKSPYFDNHPYAVDLAHTRQGNWRAFRAVGYDLNQVFEAAREWRAELSDIKRPWLCWHVDNDWSLVQQKLVESIGWTPVVGFDPRVGPPKKVTAGAVLVDFNRNLGLPILYPHFVLEFAFLFCEKIAFWHSDLLLREEKLRAMAEMFEGLDDGYTCAIKPRRGVRSKLLRREARYWELIGCTTRSASADQFNKGCGWWMDFWAHPNQKAPRYAKMDFYWDHGGGILFWEKVFKGKCLINHEKEFMEGHFTKIGNPTYKGFREAGAQSDARRSMGAEIKHNFDLGEACRSLGLEHFVEPESVSEELRPSTGVEIREPALDLSRPSVLL